MKQLTCIDCKKPIMCADMKAKLCKCQFEREVLEKPKPLTIAAELVDTIKRMVEIEANYQWANSGNK